MGGQFTTETINIFIENRQQSELKVEKYLVYGGFA